MNSDTLTPTHMGALAPTLRRAMCMCYERMLKAKRGHWTGI